MWHGKLIIEWKLIENLETDFGFHLVVFNNQSNQALSQGVNYKSPVCRLVLYRLIGNIELQCTAILQKEWEYFMQRSFHGKHPA